MAEITITQAQFADRRYLATIPAGTYVNVIGTDPVWVSSGGGRGYFAEPPSFDNTDPIFNTPTTTPIPLPKPKPPAPAPTTPKPASTPTTTAAGPMTIGTPSTNLPSGMCRENAQALCQQLSGVAKFACETAALALPKCNGGSGGGGMFQPIIPTQPTGPCGPGKILVANKCVDVTAALPGGDPLFSPGPGNAVVGAFGLPAIQPANVQMPVLRCPTGFVLGKDNLCYPRQLLGARGQFRKYKAPKKPPMTAADAAALRRIGTLQAKVKRLAKTAGIKCGPIRRR